VKDPSRTITNLNQQVTTVPVYELALMEYRLGLDAASVWLAPYPPLKLLCEQPALVREVKQRLLITAISPWSSGLWIEPQAVSWKVALAEFSRQLISTCRLAILLSLPSARRLPERRDWAGSPLGEQSGGIRKLMHILPEHGFMIDTIQGFHCGQAVLLNTVAQINRKIGCVAWADRVEFAARKQYIQPLSKAWHATCALVLATRHNDQNR
jgi:hypothetical protein